jgi:hypothetical protein
MLGRPGCYGLSLIYCFLKESGSDLILRTKTGEHCFVLLMAVIKKGEKENLTTAERTELGNLVVREILNYRKR